MLPVLLVVLVSVAGAFFSIVWSQRSQTRYAPGFTERAFASIPVGASAEEVLRLLGPPLQSKEISNGTTVWYYSEGLSKNFEHRAVVFDNGGRVINKTAVRIVD
jgi:outer membrane protein assembly factor BamE (lipoprotein component of BamABCDE complex)